MNFIIELDSLKKDLISIELKGKEGQEKISKCLDLLRETALTEVDGVKVATRLDYKLSKEENLESNTEFVINLPKSNVLKYILADGSSFVVRPSGTEPKMKVYSAVKGESLTNAEEKLKRFNEKVMEIINEKIYGKDNWYIDSSICGWDYHAVV